MSFELSEEARRIFEEKTIPYEILGSILHREQAIEYSQGLPNPKREKATKVTRIFRFEE